MQDFNLYFDLGWHHILDWKGYDHILFLLALCGIYTISDWKRVLILVTAFTVGHSITLALSVLNVVHVNTALIEFLIPVTIMVTSLSNIFNKKPKPKAIQLKYTLALAFGLIHGMGFSNYLKSLLGKSTSIVIELLAFNLGLEFGQLLIVFGVLILSFILIMIVKIKKWDWTFFLSSAIFGISFVMAAERLPAILN
ncbi:HupE / UreJ protein [Pedobacter ginsengisoli]|uniref:HupE / UreJ protein n=1 Tax=Pedobacter ginsengisoli TaxID=363852 RepID=A0A2D1U7I2_9SPHI|nr:HupE/UreJ family protein [Pedobacter ginsengisoli]ATP57558.1 HupE / UreJ protein [Pedobacter ginsengisoli]